MEILWLIIGIVIGLLIGWFFLAARYRSQLEEREAELATVRRELQSARAGGAQANDQATAQQSSKPAHEAPPGDVTQFPTSSKPNMNPDDLTQIKGIGPVLSDKLNEMGIVRFEQIADFTQSDIEQVNEALEFKGGVERERWVAQAKALANKDTQT